MTGDSDNRKSTIGYVYMIGGIIVSWGSKFLKIIALSTVEAEYVVVAKATKELVWLQNFIEELSQK